MTTVGMVQATGLRLTEILTLLHSQADVDTVIAPLITELSDPELVNLFALTVGLLAVTVEQLCEATGLYTPESWIQTLACNVIVQVAS